MNWQEEVVNKIVCGDCLELMKELPDNCVDLVVTSPPYNIGLEYDGTKDEKFKNEYFDWLVKVGKELLRVTVSGGRLCLNVGNRINTLKGMDESIDTFELFVEYKKLGWISREIITWVKTRQEGNVQNFCGHDTAWGSWMNASNPICRSYSEYIFVYSKDKWKKEPVGISDITKKEFMDWSRNVWYFPAETKRLHPAPFPKELPYRCIKFYSYKNDIILDPFVGSGTTALVAQETGRRFLGFDVSPKYVDMSNQRLAQGTLL